MADSFQGYGKMGLGAPKQQSKSMGGKWCVTEKVHGANFSMHVDRNGLLRCAKRTGFLAEHEDFFGSSSVVSRLREQITELGVALLEEDPRYDNVAFFGELCGGAYPHEAVDAEPRVQAVQQGIWYSPRVEFILFDIARLMDPCAGHDTTDSHFLPFKRCVELAEEHQIPHVPLRVVGTRGECANSNPKFQTEVPELLGYPPIEKNLAEGFVAKPWDTDTPMRDRPVFKIKIKEFSEGEGSVPPVGDPAMEAYLFGLINPNRVAAAASKVGDPLLRAHWADIVDLVLADVVEEVGPEDETLIRLVDQLRCETYDILARAVAEANKE